jgi:septum formation protein
MLEAAGCSFEVAASTFDDAGLLLGRVTPDRWVMALALLKARWVTQRLSAGDDAVVLGADTVCVMDGAVIGQPGDAEAARGMLRGFLGRTHAVLTGVAFVSPRGGRELLVDRAEVRWGVVPERDLEAYLSSGAWRGKAGGYNLAEVAELGWPVTCDGDPGTVMGLPIRLLRERLSAWSVSAGAAV